MALTELAAGDWAGERVTVHGLHGICLIVCQGEDRYALGGTLLAARGTQLRFDLVKTMEQVLPAALCCTQQMGLDHIKQTCLCRPSATIYSAPGDSEAVGLPAQRMWLPGTGPVPARSATVGAAPPGA